MAAEPSGDAARVRALTALVGVLAVAVAVLAFLVGRESGRRQSTSPAPAAAAPPTSVARPPTPPPDASDADTLAEWQALEDDGDAEPWPAPAGPEDGAAPADDAVRSYFARLDEIEREAKYWDDPQDLAMALLSQMQSGDASGFDELVSRQRDALARIDALTPPPSCADYHRRVRALMSEGVGLLERVRDAALAGDAAALLALPTAAQGLASEARELDALGKQLRGQR